MRLLIDALNRSRAQGRDRVYVAGAARREIRGENRCRKEDERRTDGLEKLLRRTPTPPLGSVHVRRLIARYPLRGWRGFCFWHKALRAFRIETRSLRPSVFPVRYSMSLQRPRLPVQTDNRAPHHANDARCAGGPGPPHRLGIELP